MKNILYLFIVFLCSILFTYAQSPDNTMAGVDAPVMQSLYLQIKNSTGNEQLGRMIAQDDASITIETKDGTEIKFDRKHISSINPLQVKVKTTENIWFQGFCTNETDSIISLIDDSNAEYTIQKHKIVEKQLLIRETDKFSNNPYGYFLLDKQKFQNENSYKSEQNYTPAPAFQKSSHEYPMLGLTFNTPGGINLIGGYHFGKFAAIGGIGCVPFGTTIWGAQVEFMFNLKSARHFEHNIGFGVGYSFIGSKLSKAQEWTYIGLFYNLNIYGFYLEPGLTIGSGTYKNPQIAFQFGYVYRFN
ncbi:MAG: hypothetical protein ABFD61_06360 [Chloroherpetonaceae bacterium]